MPSSSKSIDLQNGAMSQDMGTLSLFPAHVLYLLWSIPHRKAKDPSKNLKFLYMYEFLSYLTLTKSFVLVLKQEYYRNLKITEPGIGCVIPKFSFQTPSLKFCVILHSDSSHTWGHQITS
jgi:hypothetical protein